MEKKFKIKINSVEKIEAILQEIYDDSVRQINLIQNKINELESSTNLSEETIDMKAKYAKAIHDYITDKEKAIGRKLDLSRLMAEILKHNGDVETVMNDKQIIENLDDVFNDIRNAVEEAGSDTNDTEKPEVYITNKNKY